VEAANHTRLPSCFSRIPAVAQERLRRLLVRATAMSRRFADERFRCAWCWPCVAAGGNSVSHRFVRPRFLTRPADSTIAEPRGAGIRTQSEISFAMSAQPRSWFPMGTRVVFIRFAELLRRASLRPGLYVPRVRLRFPPSSPATHSDSCNTPSVRTTDRDGRPSKTARGVARSALNSNLNRAIS
jgi:hypothetical protein